MDRDLLIRFAEMLENRGCEQGWPVTVLVGEKFGMALIDALRTAAVRDMEGQ